ncbi:hypothetical protein KDL01_20285 [Actinospica durhamensis]|uniref:DUF6869 domain-containing protein n=1 Tax=Actinospica durhamensis TaxID=1508375 RepID=A0A941ENF5_9ACTN|nr:hypothetical protein [Actinospica durhamensis]MBR7835625.1 hypothetical protein [Actinospica durhamensis]
MTDDLDELARAWWEGRRLADGTRDERKRWSLGEPADVAAAWERVQRIVGDGGEPALELVLALLRGSPDEAGYAMVGAGPLEDVVTRYGNDLAPRLDELARQSPAFRRALASVWL